MTGKEVFQGHQEQDRLLLQTRFLKQYEQPIYQRLVAGQSGLRVLDLGCNDRSKTVDWFSGDEVQKVIGLEYLDALAHKAQEQYGGGKFSFYSCDVEAPDFIDQLQSRMQENGVAAFDLIYTSLVLMHLKNPCSLLKQLKQVLAPNGCLMVIEGNDAVSRLSPDPDHLLQQFLDILSTDPLSGDRNCGGKVPAFLSQCGYRQITVENTVVEAGQGALQKKKDFYEIFFSYLPQDLEILCKEQPDIKEYAVFLDWVKKYHAQLRQLILSEESEISMGLSIISCTGDGYGRE